MSNEIFEQLLDSYTGIRQRNWNPSFLEEAWDPTPEQQTAVQDIGKAFAAALTGTALQGGGQNTNVNMTPQPNAANPGNPKVLIQAKGLSMSWGESDFRNKFQAKLDKGNTNARKLVGIWAPQEKEPTRQGDDAAPGFNGDTEGDTGFVEPVEDEDKKIGSDLPPGTLNKAPRVNFTDTQRAGIEKMLVRPNHLFPRGATPEEAKEYMDRLEDTANTPSQQTKIGKAIANIMGGREDMREEVIRQAMDINATLHAVANDIQTYTDKDGTVHRYLPQEHLGGSRKEALRTVTIRGEKGQKGVFIGGNQRRPIDPNGLYAELQSYVQQYDSSDYGTAWGGNFNDLLHPTFHGVRILPEGVDPATVEDWESLEHGTRRSASVETREAGGATTNLSNDFKGKLFEDVVMIQAAKMSGESGSMSEASEGLRKRLVDGKDMAEAEFDHLETILMSDEFEGLVDFNELDALGIPKEEILRLALRQAGAHTENFFRTYNLLTPGLVIGTSRPSKESKLGEKADIDIELNPDMIGSIPAKLRGQVTIRPDGTAVLRTSEKFYKNLQVSTGMGSVSLLKVFDPTHPEADEATALLDSHLDRMLESGVLSRADSQGVRQTLEADRAAFKEWEKRFTRMTEADRADCLDYVRTESENPTPEFPTFEAREAYIQELEDLRVSLMRPNFGAGKKDKVTHDDSGKATKGGTPIPDERQAALRLWQLDRMARQQADPAHYGRNTALIDTVCSVGTFDDEAIMRGCPGWLSMGSNHQLLDSIAAGLFNEEFKPKFKLGGSSIVNEQGETVWNNVSRAKTTEGLRKFIGEGSLTSKGLQLLLETIGSAPTELPPVESEEGEEGEEKELPEGVDGLERGVLDDILNKLPSIETDKIVRRGSRLVQMLHPFCLKIKAGKNEYEGGYASQSKALDALDTIRTMAKQYGDKLTAHVYDYDSDRTLS